MENKKPRIVLNMIVKNESKIIKRCIDSCYNIIDAWCIVDTGSTDGTQEIIKESLKDKPGILHEKPWVNFGHNRNEALELAREWGEWIFLTDADMVLIDQGFNVNQLDIDFDVYDIRQDNHGTVYNNMRLLNTKKQWRCIGVTHEYYDCVEGVSKRGFCSTLLFNDISDGGSKGDKFERDIKLLTQGLIDEPENHRYMFYLAQSYRDIQDYDNAIKWYKKRVDAGAWEEEQWFAQYMVGWCMIARNDKFEDIWTAMMEAWRMRPWRCEPAWMLGMEARKKQMWQHAYQLFKLCVTTEYPQNDVLFIAKAAYGVSSIDEYSIAAYYAEHYLESEKACEKLLQHPELPKSEIARVKKNLWFSQKQLGKFSEDAFFQYLEQKKKTI